MKHITLLIIIAITATSAWGRTPCEEATNQLVQIEASTQKRITKERMDALAGISDLITKRLFSIEMSRDQAMQRWQEDHRKQPQGGGRKESGALEIERLYSIREYADFGTFALGLIDSCQKFSHTGYVSPCVTSSTSALCLRCHDVWKYPDVIAEDDQFNQGVDVEWIIIKEASQEEDGVNPREVMESDARGLIPEARDHLTAMFELIHLDAEQLINLLHIMHWANLSSADHNSESDNLALLNYNKEPELQKIFNPLWEARDRAHQLCHPDAPHPLSPIPAIH